MFKIFGEEYIIDMDKLEKEVTISNSVSGCNKTKVNTVRFEFFNQILAMALDQTMEDDKLTFKSTPTERDNNGHRLSVNTLMHYKIITKVK